MMPKSLVVLFIVLAASLNVNAISDIDSKKVFLEISPILAQCIDQFSMTLQDFKKAKDPLNKSTGTSCFIACFFKRYRFLNERGSFDKLVAQQAVHRLLSDPASVATALGIIEDCTSVNNESLNDGPRGCIRAQFLYDCMIAHMDDVFVTLRDKIYSYYN